MIEEHRRTVNKLVNCSIAGREACKRRISKELVYFNKDPPTNCSAGPINDSDLLYWQANHMSTFGFPISRWGF